MLKFLFESLFRMSYIVLYETKNILLEIQLGLVWRKLELSTPQISTIPGLYANLFSQRPKSMIPKEPRACLSKILFINVFVINLKEIHGLQGKLGQGKGTTKWLQSVISVAGLDSCQWVPVNLLYYSIGQERKKESLFFLFFFNIVYDHNSFILSSIRNEQNIHLS